MFIHPKTYDVIVIGAGHAGIEADWSMEPIFFRNFSLKLMGLASPQHFLFVSFTWMVLLIRFLTRKESLLNRSFGEGVFVAFACLALVSVSIAPS